MENLDPRTKGTYCFLFEGIKLTQNHQITIYGYAGGDEKVCEDEAAFTIQMD